MAPSRKNQKVATTVPSSRNVRCRTRLHKPKLVADPAHSTLQLTNQLRALGLYAAPTLGDGNCLFRALADQLWGSPSDHLKLRAEICDWMEARKERYEGFVDEDRSFETHIKCMRMPGTYGGHLELSAFAHLQRCNVKVIQPGLVYVIEWSGGRGGDPSPSVSQASGLSGMSDDDGKMSERKMRRLRRDLKKQALEREKTVKKQEHAAADDDETPAVAYLAYHDWEHFSSVRNLSGPHTGPPRVVERPERVIHPLDNNVTPKPTPASKAKGKGKAASRALATLREKAQSAAPPAPVEPSNIPLPPSRSVSPSSSSISPWMSQASAGTSAPSSLAPLTPPDISAIAINERSPKRTFDESENVVPPTLRLRKRHKASDMMDVDEDVDDNTPSLSDASSQASSSSSSTLSSPSPPAEPDPLPQRPLTRRQRKALGLPKPRTVPLAGKTRSAGKIVIPGGRYPLRSAAGEVEGEWRSNGSGRVDVRGFRELKI